MRLQKWSTKVNKCDNDNTVMLSLLLQPLRC